MDPLLVVLLALVQFLQSLSSSAIEGRVTLGDVDAPAPNVTITCAARGLASTGVEGSFSIG